jgi:hypothetical protein
MCVSFSGGVFFMNVKERALAVWKCRENTLIHLTSFLRILLIFFGETFLGLNKTHFMVGWLAGWLSQEVK